MTEESQLKVSFPTVVVIVSALTAVSGAVILIMGAQNFAQLTGVSFAEALKMILASFGSAGMYALIGSVVALVQFILSILFYSLTSGWLKDISLVVNSLGKILGFASTVILTLATLFCAFAFYGKYMTSGDILFGNLIVDVVLFVGLVLLIFLKKYPRSERIKS